MLAEDSEDRPRTAKGRGDILPLKKKHETVEQLNGETVLFYDIAGENNYSWRWTYFMVTVIKQFFKTYIKPSEDSSPEVSEHSLQIATAALLIEMMRADYEITEEEKQVITGSMRSKFNLSSDEIAAILKLAEDEIWSATGYYEFTSLINQGFNYEQKTKVIEHLWEVAFADLILDKHEEYMVRKISNLIRVSHKDFIEAKLRVKKKM